jgi:hypothetical protein
VLEEGRRKRKTTEWRKTRAGEEYTRTVCDDRILFYGPLFLVGM